MAEQLGTGDTVFSKGHAIVVLSWSGCNFTVTVIGPVEGDAKEYATAIDAWRETQGLKGSVRWSQEDDCAAAKFAYIPGHVGMKEASTTLDLAGLRETALALEPKTEFAVTDAVWSKVDMGFSPDATSPAGTRYWNLTKTRPGLSSVTGTIKLASWVPGLMLAWFLIPPLGILACFGIGIACAKNQKLPLKDRRRLYGKVVSSGTYAVLGLHGILVIATLPTRMFDPMAQLWFGMRFAQLALPIVPLFVFVPLLSLPVMNRVEKRLFGPSEEEKVLQEPIVAPPRQVAPGPKSRLFYIAWGLRIVGLCIMLARFQLPKTVAFRDELNLLGWFLFFAPAIFLIRIRKYPTYVVEPETLTLLESKLQEHVATMADRLEMTAPTSRVLTEVIYGRFGAILDRRGLGITFGALEELATGELDFLVAHEMAHDKLGHLKRRKLMIYLPAVFAAVPMFAILAGRSLAVSSPSFIFTPMLIPIGLMFPYVFYMRRVMREQEFAADRLAIYATGDAATAQIALRKITLNSASPGVHDLDMATHPAVDARLAAMATMG